MKCREPLGSHVTLCRTPRVSSHASDPLGTNLEQNSRASTLHLRLVFYRWPRLTLPRSVPRSPLPAPSLRRSVPPSGSAGSALVQVRCSHTEAGFDRRTGARERQFGKVEERKRRTNTEPSFPPHLTLLRRRRLTFLLVPTPHIPSSPLRNSQ